MTFARAKSAEKQRAYPTGRKTTNITKFLRDNHVFAMIVLIAFATLMTVKPDFYLNSARKGLYLYATTVLPSIFPFYFLAMLLTKIGAAKTLSVIFEKPMKKLYRTPKESAYVMLLSMISGYPVGAACTKELYLSGAITLDDAKSISAFASTSGPIFMLGTLGAAIFENVWIGVIILVSHYLGAFLNGFLYRKRKTVFIADENEHKNGAGIYPQNALTADAFSDSVTRSTLSMLALGGYIVIFGIVVDTLSLLRVDASLLNAFGDKAQPLISLVFGLVEMTRGSIECAKCSYLPLGVALAAFVVSFGGLSVIFQNYAYLSTCGMKFREIIVRKLTHSLIAFGISFLLSFACQKIL